MDNIVQYSCPTTSPDPILVYTIVVLGLIGLILAAGLFLLVISYEMRHQDDLGSIRETTSKFGI